MSEPDGLALYRFSTDALPERDRVGMWREFFGRHIAGLDLEPGKDGPLRFEIEQQSLNRISVATALLSACRMRRTPELLADNRHDKVLLMPVNGGIFARQRGREAAVREGEAVLLTHDDAHCVETAEMDGSVARLRCLHVMLAHEVVAALAPGLEDAILNVIPAGNEALGLLRNYLGMLGRGDGLVTAYTAHTIATHVQDLAVLAIGASDEAGAVARRRGLGAARLAVVQALIQASLADLDLTLSRVAKHSGISPHYVRKLFAAQGTGFSKYVLEQRLARACRMLASPAFAHLRISDIAYNCGFGDLSYFNRAFRRRHGMTPSEVRAEAPSRVN